MMDTIGREQLLAQVVVSQGIAKQDQVKECLVHIRALHDQGADPIPSLPQLLLIRGYIDGTGYDRVQQLSLNAMQAVHTKDLPEEVEKALGDGQRDMGKFILVTLLGRGGMGEVWKAWEKNLGRTVAIKFYRGKNYDDQRRFLREGQVVARLSHPNIAPVHEIDMHGEQPYLVMQYIDGTTIEKAPLDLPALLKSIRDVARALDYAHEHGVIHRDIKPSNIMMEKDKVWLLDFGLARQMKVDSSISESGTIMGTPQYMSPEQARGLSKLIDARTDVYSLGATLYTLLCKRPAFDTKPDDVMITVLRRVAEEEPPPPRRVNPKIPADLETIILKAMEKERERRYQTAGELADDLQRFMDQEPIKARRASVLYSLQKKFSKHRWVVMPAGAAVLMAFAFGVYVFGSTMALRTQKAMWISEAEKAEAETNWQEALLNYERAYALDPGDLKIVDKKTSIKKFADDQRRRLEKDAEKAAEHVRARAVYAEAEKSLISLLARSYDPTWRLNPEERLAAEAIAEACLAQMRKTGEIAAGLWVVGQARRLLGDWAAEEQAYDAALKAEPENPRCLAYKAKVSIERAILETINPWRNAEVESRARERIAAAAPLLKQALAKGLSGLDGDLARGYELLASGQSVQEHCDGALKAHSGQPFGEQFYILRGLAPKGNLVADAGLAIEARPAWAEGYFWRGEGHRNNGDQSGAIKDFSQALEINPRDSKTLIERARAAEERGDLMMAIEDYTRALEISPSGARVHMLRGLARRAHGDLPGAISDLGHAVEIDPALAEGFLHRGIARHESGDMDGAIEDFNRALKIQPSFPEAYSHRGLARRDTIDLKGALEDCDRAVEINPKLAVAYVHRGRVREALKQFDGAIDDYSKAIDLVPWDAMAFSLRGLARYRKGDIGGAIEDCNTAVDKNPRLAEGYEARAVVRRARNDRKGSAEDFAKALELNPRMPAAYLASGNARRSRRDVQGAIEDYSRAIDLNPQHVDAHVARGAARAESGDAKGAEQDLGRATELAPRDPRAYLARAQLRRSRKDVDGAIADYTKLIDLNPRDGKAYYDRAELRKSKGDQAGAIADYNRAIEIGAQDARIFYERAIAKKAREDWSGAEDDLSRAIEADPTHIPSYVARAEARAKLKDWAGAIADYTKLIEGSPKEAAHWAARGQVHLAKGDMVNALSDLSKAIDLKKDDPQLFLARAQIRKAQGDVPGAILDLTQAVALGIESVEVFVLRGDLKKLKKDLRGAVEDYSRAIDLGATDPRLLLARATSRRESNDQEGALQDYSRLIVAGSQDPEVFFHRAELRALKGDFQGAVEDYTIAISRNSSYGDAYVGRAMARAGPLRAGTSMTREKLRSILEEIRKDLLTARELGGLHPEAQRKLEEGLTTVERELRNLASMPEPPPPQQQPTERPNGYRPPMVPPQPPPNQGPSPQPPPYLPPGTRYEQRAPYKR